MLFVHQVLKLLMDYQPSVTQTKKTVAALLYFRHPSSMFHLCTHSNQWSQSNSYPSSVKVKHLLWKHWSGAPPEVKLHRKFKPHQQFSGPVSLRVDTPFRLDLLGEKSPMSCRERETSISWKQTEGSAVCNAFVQQIKMNKNYFPLLFLPIGFCGDYICSN